MSNLPVVVGGSGMPTVALAEALNSAVDYARAEKSEATRRAYASDWAHFEAWCRASGAVALPANTATVAAYLASLADGGLKASTINRRIAALTYTHRQAGVTPPTGAESVKAVQRGIRRTIGTAVTRKAPATDKHVRAMIKALPDTLAGLRDRALLAIGFSAAMRRSEVVALNLADVLRAPEGIFILIRRSKTDQEGAGREVPILAGSKLKPVKHLDAWLAAACIAEGPLFRAVAKGGRVASDRLTDRSVADIVKRSAERAKLDPTMFSGHSLRAGFVTSALEHGADAMKVMDVTGHKQVQTLKIYDRRAKAFKDHAGKGFL